MGKVKVLHAGDTKKTMYGAGDHYAFLAEGAETDGKYFLMEGVVPPGGGPPPHIQNREEEAFYILEGEVTFWADGETVYAKPGSFVHIPAGAKHNFRNEGEVTARMLIFFAPAGIEKMFDKIAADPENIVEYGEEFGVEFFPEGWVDPGTNQDAGE